MSELLVAGADGRPIPVTDEGQGPAVLLLHSGSADRSSWARVAAALAGRFRVLRFDRWTYRDGHADAVLSGTETMAAEVADVLAVAAAARRGPDTAGVPRSAGERPLLVGHSSGAVVALESALADPSAFRAMVLYEPPVAADEPLGGEALRRARAALDAGDPDRAITIHMREIAGAGRLMVAGLRRLPPAWQVIRGTRPPRSPTTRPSSPSGSAWAAMPAWTCPCCCWAAAAARTTCGSGSTRWPPCSPGWRGWSSWRARATWPTCAPPARSPG
jgi:pimeloyl-ACP methyl ester carboxylesterase